MRRKLRPTTKPYRERHLFQFTCKVGNHPASTLHYRFARMGLCRKHRNPMVGSGQRDIFGGEVGSDTRGKFLIDDSKAKGGE